MKFEGSYIAVSDNKTLLSTMSWADPEKISKGGGGRFLLPTRVGPTKFYNFKTHTLENRRGFRDPTPLDPRLTGNAPKTYTACH